MKIGQSKFRADTYNLIDNNCNNFTDDCSQFLISEGIPSRKTKKFFLKEFLKIF